MSSAQPLVSIIIPTYNCTKFLGEALDSALAQTYTNKEIIVVDDGSTDNTQDLVASYGYCIRYIYQKNAGTAAARNTGIKNSSGGLIALLDHDDRWLAHKIETQVPYFDDPSVGLVHTGGRVFKSDTGAISSEYLPEPILDLHDLMSWCKVGCATTMFRREAIDKVGLFDEELFGTDDWDMWIRISAEHKVIGCREVLSEIRLHGGNQGTHAEKMFQQGMKAINKPRHFHESCLLCASSLRKARTGMRTDYYVRVCNHSRALASEGNYAKAFAMRIKAVFRDPAALARMPSRLYSHLVLGKI